MMIRERGRRRMWKGQKNRVCDHMTVQCSRNAARTYRVRSDDVSFSLCTAVRTMLTFLMRNVTDRKYVFT